MLVQLRSWRSAYLTSCRPNVMDSHRERQTLTNAADYEATRTSKGPLLNSLPPTWSVIEPLPSTIDGSDTCKSLELLAAAHAKDDRQISFFQQRLAIKKGLCPAMLSLSCEDYSLVARVGPCLPQVGTQTDRGRTCTRPVRIRIACSFEAAFRYKAGCWRACRNDD